MEKVILQAEPRGTGRHPIRELRDGSRVPAVVYGKGVDPQPISLNGKALGIGLHAAAGSLMELQIAGQPLLHVLVREVQRHPTRHYIQHVDFYAVSLTQRVRVHVPIVSEGTGPILANPDMVLVRNLDAVEVECLPTDIPEHVVAELSSLRTVDDEVLVKALRVPTNVKVLTEGDQVVFAVTASRAAVEEETTAEAPAADQVEVVTKRKPKEEAEEEKR